MLALAAATTSGCSVPPHPEPAASAAFATEEEAFAAAEETYRAYVEALNQVDLSDPATFEAVYAWTTGDANAEARETFTEMHAKRWVVEGESIPTIVQAISSVGDEHSPVQVAVCVDVSEVTVSDDSGTSVVSPERGNVQSMQVTTRLDDSTSTGMIIESFVGRGGSPECSDG